MTIGNGRCCCACCGNWYGGNRQTAAEKKKWRSPCCNAKGILWEKVKWVKDE